MFGERYFATRERLSKVVRSIAEFATATDTDLGEHLTLADMQSGFGTPFLFVVCGEVNAGKSTLLNGLFGHDFCRVNILPETRRVLWYGHGDPARDVEVTPLLEQRYRPLEFLRDFNLVDTPGTNSSIQGHQEITARFLTAAHLLLFVFPISNPWGAATWDAITQVPAAARERLVLIIQQADQREAQDIKVILDHMADLSMKRLGLVPPIFAVSGQLAYQAKCVTPVAKDLMLASGYPALEDYIARTICQSPEHRKALETWRSQAAAALRIVEDRIEEQAGNINSQSRFIEQLESEIDGIREQFITRLSLHLAGVAEVFESHGIHTTQLLRRRLRAWPSIIRLFTGDSTGPAMEAVFIERLQSAVEAVAEKDGGEVADACHDHWLDLGARVKSTIGVDLNATDLIDATLTTARNRFVQRLGHAARQGIGNLKVRHQLDPELRRRNLALQSFVFMTLVLTIAAATCGVLGVPWAPGILSGLAALFLTCGIMVAWATRASITRDFQDRLRNTCGTFASTLHSDYEEALRLVFRDYASSLDNVRTHLAREKLAFEPCLRRWQELFLTLKAIEQEL
jgi:predicted GTPase